MDKAPAMPIDAAQVELEKLRDREIRNYEALAALETIRVNQFVPFTWFKRRDGGNDTTTQIIKFDKFEKGYVYVITSICGLDETTAANQIRIGVIDGDTKVYFESATTANIGDSVEYVGQLMLKETDIVFVEFWGVELADILKVSLNGYKIRR